MTNDFVLYAQHGWADTCDAIAKLTKVLATSQTVVITTDLGYFKTWLRIKPLIEQVEQIAIDTLNLYPHTPMRIIGHSMGGLIWLEVLNRNPQWWSKIDSLVLIASPVGSSDLARIIDPLGIGIGIARDLGINRRPIAEKIAAHIPTLVIAGDIDNGTDGTITVQTTKFSGAKFVCLQGISHAALRNHPSLVDIIRDFWANPVITVALEPDFTTSLIQRLQSVPGMTDGHPRDFPRAKVSIVFKNDVTVRTWKNLVQIDHVFVANPEGECLYSGYLGWLHSQDLRQSLKEISKLFLSTIFSED